MPHKDIKVPHGHKCSWNLGSVEATSKNPWRGHLLTPEWGLSLKIQLCLVLVCPIHPQYTCPIHDMCMCVFSNRTIIISGACVIQSLSRSDNDTRMLKFGWVLLKVRASIGTASGMRHWEGMIKIICDTDCYYCIIKVYCSPLAWYDVCASVLNLLICLHPGSVLIL